MEQKLKQKKDFDRSRDQELIRVVPSKRQLAQQQMEFYGFIHFTVNTFTGREWGDGTESEEIFAPSRLDAEQWTAAAKAGGMKGLILTCKHHDGFCLWPSAHTSHSITGSPYQNGKGDLVREVSKACEREGLKFGVYLSPWDRNHPAYGYGKAYDDYFAAQLTELLTNYGEVFTVWLDGACGEGNNGKKQIYDWERYYQTIRKLQPNACISVCGPDIRWCGNEAGENRPNEWSVVPKRLSDKRVIAENSQQKEDVFFRQRKISAMDLDLGSRNALKGEKDLIWYPSEVDISIRPGWFYHSEEDDKVKTLEELKSIYLGSVGGNAMLLLNIPPTPDGLIHENDVKRLKELGNFIRDSFAKNLLETGNISSDFESKNHSVEQVCQDDYESWYQPEEGTSKVQITISWKNVQRIRYVVLKEAIPCGQRIEAFTIGYKKGKKEVILYQGSTVGYKKIIKVADIMTKELVIRIEDARVAPMMSFIGVYEAAL